MPGFLRWNGWYFEYVHTEVELSDKPEWKTYHRTGDKELDGYLGQIKQLTGEDPLGYVSLPTPTNVRFVFQEETITGGSYKATLILARAYAATLLAKISDNWEG